MQERDTTVWYVGLGSLSAAIFAADLFTPLGVAVWILYVVPLGLTLVGRDATIPVIGAVVATLLMVLTLFTDEPGITAWVAYVNRLCGIVVVWAIALLSRRLIITRNALEGEEWIRGTQTRLFEAMQGELSLQQIGDRALGVIADAVDAQVAAVYAHTGSELRLVASHGLRAGTDLPESFNLGDSLVGEAARSGRLRVIHDVPESFFTIRSGLLRGVPRHLVVSPLLTDGALQGVMEVGLLRAPEQRSLDLIERIRHGVGVAIRTAFYRDRLRALLEETQRQSETLQMQQEELRVTNEELEEQSEILKASQARLELQQAELEAANAQLENQTEDLAQQKQALSVAKQDAERASQYKSEFLANMSHELRTPLNSTLILAKLLADNKGGRLSADEVRYAETIYSSGNSLLMLINDILDLSKIEAGAVHVQPEPVSPASIVDGLHRTFQPLASEKQLEFTVDVLPATPAAVSTDGHRLQQILNNLLSNAFKFTERGGVVLRVSPAGADAVAFEVRDTGTGIAPEQQAMVFEAFRQADGSTHRKYGGTGLGLSISRELAHLLGGEILLKSEPGKGSTFTLTIPSHLDVARAIPRARREAGAGTPAMVPATAPAGRAAGAAAADKPRVVTRLVTDDRENRRHPGRLILVVEDDVHFARILHDLAHELDFDCVVASSNDEGMVLARDLAPSGILLDVNLPDGSGLTLLDRLKRNPDTRHIPVHMVSVGDNAQTALSLGAVGYALKPVPRDEIVKAIRRLEDRLAQRVRRVLVVEDDERLRDSITALLHLDQVAIHAVGTAREALHLLATESFDCVVLDLNLPDASGYEILETMSGNEQYSFPPVVVYTGGPISPEDEERLRRYSRSVIVKGARSPERLLDEVTLFLHQVESRLPSDARRLLEAARERDELFEGKKILVVEDDVRNVFALTSVFEPRGATITIARNGREAIEQVAKSRPDLVLMDIMMPEMDGLTATKALRSNPALRDLPIIALTAKAMPDDYERCIAAGASDYLPKPLDVDKLVSLCRVWMSR